MFSRRFALVISVAISSVLIAATPAFAHVTVNPKTFTKGSFSELGFRVPNEKDAASTVRVEITFPADQPIAHVSVQPQLGWTYVVEKRKLGQPIENHHENINEVVSKITWSGGQIKPGEYFNFYVSAGPLPDTSQLTFKALQTYSDGEVVRWIDEAPAGGAEPDHPAPVMTIAAPGAAAAVTEDDGTENVLGVIGIVLGGLALIAALGGIATRRKETAT